MRRSLPLIFTLGAMGFAAFNMGLYWALNYTTAINAAIEQSGMPVLIILANYLFFKMRITALQLLGVILTITGVVVTARNARAAKLAGMLIRRLLQTEMTPLDD